jgi:hypothetical protein
VAEDWIAKVLPCLCGAFKKQRKSTLLQDALRLVRQLETRSYKKENVGGIEKN